jgi:TRAP-type C4-dicarboxylate transport system substrate-binding protein
MKKNIFSVIALTGLLLLSLMTSVGIAAEKPIELRFTTVVTSTHHNFKTAQEFASKVSTRTDGKVKIRVYPSGTLNPPLQTYNAILTGIADIGGAPVGYSGQIMPLNKLFGDALRMMPNSSAATKAWENALNRVPEMKKELDGIHLLWAYSTLPFALSTKDREIKSVEDAKGLVMRVPPGLEPVAKTWGVSPASMPIGDLYVALQKGVIHGLIASPELLKSHKLIEQTKYVTPLFLTHGLSYIGINKKTWDAFSPDIKKVFEELSVQTGISHRKAFDASEKELLDFIVSQGNKIVNLDKANLERFHSLAKPAFEKIAEDLEAKGKPGKKVLAEVERAVSEAQK